MKKILLILALIVSITLNFALLNQTTASGYNVQKSPFSLRINGDEVNLKESYNINGRTYVQLREMCGHLGVNVFFRDKWTSYGPGGAKLNGISLDTSPYIHTKSFESGETVGKFEDTGGDFVDVTSLIKGYTDTKANLYFTVEDTYYYYFNIKNGSEITKTKLNLAYANGYHYMLESEFKTLLLPHLVEFSKQGKITQYGE